MERMEKPKRGTSIFVVNWLDFKGSVKERNTLSFRTITFSVSNWFCVVHCKFDTGMNVVECINEKMNDYSSSLSTILADFEGGRGPLIMTY